MRTCRFRMIAGVLLLSMLLTTRADAAAHSEWDLPMPRVIHLSDQQVPLYDEQNGKIVSTLSSSEYLIVLGSEENWRQKLARETDSEVWFKIVTKNKEEGWVLVRNPEFEEAFYDFIELSGPEVLYAGPSDDHKTDQTVEPQTVSSIVSYNGFYKINTWAGPKWIRPAHPYRNNISLMHGSWITLTSKTPFFDSPGTKPQPLGFLAKQYVQAYRLFDKEWYEIQTWQGLKWVNPTMAYPLDLQSVSETIDLPSETDVYAYPSLRQEPQGRLAPQQLHVLEKGSGWYHIQSDWLEEAWIYMPEPASDPLRYSPPDSVQAKPVQGDWTFLQLDPNSTGSRGYPLAPAISPGNGGRIQFGGPVQLAFSLQNASSDSLTIRDLGTVEIEIVRLTGPEFNRQRQPVWRGSLPGWSGALKSRMSSEMFRFSWDQKDSDGKQVPFGDYMAEIKLPWTISYTTEGKEEPFEQQVDSSIRTKFAFRIGAP